MSIGRRLLLIGVALYVVFLLATMPARKVLPAVLPEEVSLTAIQGSVWRGRAAGLVADGMQLGPLEWRFRPFSLFMLKLAYFVDAKLPGGFAKGDVGVRPGSLILEDVNALVPVGPLAQAVAPIVVDGQASIAIAHARLEQGWPVALEGQVRLANLAQQRPALQLGDYEISFPGDGGDAEGLVGALKDLGGGPLAVEGRLLLRPDRAYQVDVLALPRADAPASLERVLRLIPRDAEGRYQISLAGTL